MTILLIALIFQRRWLADLAPSRRFGGCCGINGPIPLPLLMRSCTVVHILVECEAGVKAGWLIFGWMGGCKVVCLQ